MATSNNPVENIKDYAVVKIQAEDDGFCYSEVPSNWLRQVDGEYKQCWWPKTECTSQQIINREEPDAETWCIIDIELDKFCSTYHSARKRAENEYYVTTDDNGLGKGRRKKIPTRRESVENEKPSKQKKSHQRKRQATDSGTESESSEIPEAPKNLFTNSGNGGVIMNSSKVISPDPVEEIADPLCIQSYDDMKRFENNCINLSKQLTDVKFELRSLGTRISNIEKIVQINNNISCDEKELLNRFLPLSKELKILELNTKLKDENLALVFKKLVSSIGGLSEKNLVNNALATTIKNKCAKKYTWKGHTDKPAAENLRFISLIRDTLCNSRLGLTIANFNQHASEWLRLAKQRYEREQAKKKKSLENEDVTERRNEVNS